MSYLQPVLFSEDVTSDDDIDRLFSQLEQIEPPTSLVNSILASISQLAGQQRQRFHDISSQSFQMIVHNEHQEPS
ncbi:MAG TPA: hypothetical protein DHW02_07875 [Ktedonobacter sp.]|jgi:hypothetical protein|nr:hypothetical protein [Ktedonobacter sp.]